MVDFSSSSKAAKKKDDHHEFQCIKQIGKNTAGEFLEYLNPLKEQWGRGPKSPWIFRGQGNASWGLVPKAWREEAYGLLQPIMMRLRQYADKAWFDLYSRSGKTKDKSMADVLEVLTHTASVNELTYFFAQLADELGYPVPGITDICPGKEFIEKHEWPDFDYEKPSDAFALSQHHGLPTALLDWTRTPWFAAFFAADSNLGIETPRSGKRPDLAVWAANLKQINTDRYQPNALCPLKCPRSENNFLHAQDALFLWYPEADVFRLEERNWPDFLEVVNRGYSKSQPKPIQKITLKGEQVQELIYQLYRLRISRAHLMPTYDNIAKTVEYGSFIENVDLFTQVLSRKS